MIVSYRESWSPFHFKHRNKIYMVKWLLGIPKMKSFTVQKRKVRVRETEEFVHSHKVWWQQIRGKNLMKSSLSTAGNLQLMENLCSRTFPLGCLNLGIHFPTESVLCGMASSLRRVAFNPRHAWTCPSGFHGAQPPLATYHSEFWFRMTGTHLLLRSIS